MDFNRHQFTEKATDDFYEILDYITNTLYNPIAAKKFFAHVFDALDKLCLFPRSCPLVENEFIKRKGVRKALIDNYILYYVYNEVESVIIVLRILYGGMNIDGILNTI